jgi:hypothetical protein
MATGIFPAPALPFTRIATVTASGTWDHPDGYSSARPIFVVAIGGGAGGGSGEAVITNTDAGTRGGGGGGSGLVCIANTFITSQATVTIGAAGTGGAAVTKLGSAGTGTTIGNDGTSGGDTIFSATGILVRTQIAQTQVAEQYGRGGSVGSNGGSGASGGGSNPTGTSTNGGGSLGYAELYGFSQSSWAYGKGYINPASAAGATGTSTFPLSNPTCAQYASGGGGAGGKQTTTAGFALLTAGVGGNGFNGNNGATGGAAAKSLVANGTATATAGSNATNYGGGGAGGGSAQVANATIATATATSGKGGDGAPGVVYIYY